ncbi:MAG: BamA/TamA family outer membrane protein [Candidatus Marinimicrobia bacterium]|nr:BamA/TamA family outer membrane protein [Candidatus Neomarinimicrobiota bacterium]
MKNTLRILMIIIIVLTALATADDIVKTGINIGPLPSVAYNSDTGFQYGLLANIFFYGDGSIYPEYFHNVYVEWNQTTKGAGLATIQYDSEHLIPGIRITADISNIVQQSWGFYGFNGAQSVYNASWLDDTPSNADYKNRLYYAMQRNYFRLLVNFQGNITGDNFRWLGGLGFMSFNIGSVTETRAWDTTFTDNTTLYDDFVGWGAISASEADGGIVTYLKGGIVYDTRDNEACPMTGLWDELVITAAPGFVGNESGWLQVAAIHRQYFTIIPKDLSLTYRLGYQGVIAGTMPFYLQGMMPNSRTTVDGLGGNKTVRGIMRARMVGDGYIYANFEARWKIVHFTLGTQNFYFGINPFVDAGMVIQPYQYDKTSIPAGVIDDYISGSNETLHIGYGMGIKLAMNQNMILAVDYGFAGSSNDGSTGLYIGLGYLY